MIEALISMAVFCGLWCSLCYTDYNHKIQEKYLKQKINQLQVIVDDHDSMEDAVMQTKAYKLPVKKRGKK